MDQRERAGDGGGVLGAASHQGEIKVAHFSPPVAVYMPACRRISISCPVHMRRRSSPPGSVKVTTRCSNKRVPIL